MKELREKILDLIVSRDGYPITSSGIKNILGIPDGEGNPRTRALIKDLMRKEAKKRGIPIGATNKGYFLLKHRSDFYEYLQDLQYRIAGIHERIRLVEDAWEIGDNEVLCGNKV